MYLEGASGLARRALSFWRYSPVSHQDGLPIRPFFGVWWLPHHNGQLGRRTVAELVGLLPLLIGWMRT